MKHSHGDYTHEHAKGGRPHNHDDDKDDDDENDSPPSAERGNATDEPAHDGDTDTDGVDNGHPERPTEGDTDSDGRGGDHHDNNRGDEPTEQSDEKMTEVVTPVEMLSAPSGATRGAARSSFRSHRR